MTKINTLKSYKLFFSLFLFLISTSLLAQQNNSIQKWYVEGGVGGTSKQGLQASAGVKAIWKNNWVTAFNYHSITMEAKNLPKDFDPGYIFVLIFPIPNPTPKIDMSIVSLEAGKKFNGGKNTWFTTTAGLSLVNTNELKFTKATHDPSWNALIFGEKFSNYNYTDEKKSTFGATVKADFNWAFASFAGLGAGVFTNFNSIQSPVGLELKLMVGKMDRQKRKRS